MKGRSRRRTGLYPAACLAVLAAALALGQLSADRPGAVGKAAAVSAMLMLPEGAAAVISARLAPPAAVVVPEREDPGPVYEYTASPGSALSPAEPPDEIALPQETIPTEADDPPDADKGTVTELCYTASAQEGYIPLPAGYLKNSTALSDEQVLQVLQTPCSLRIEPGGEPQVLILHTHATEAFSPFDRDICDLRDDWRDTNNEQNVVFLGRVLAAELEKAGIAVLHDTTQHDYPSYNGSYERSADTIRAYLQQYPSIKAVIDLHRDAIESPVGNLIRPVTLVGGEKTAQVMIIAGCDDGTMDMPGWRENLRWAAALQSRMEADWPGLTRPVFFCHRKYNMDLTGGSLLIEIGSHGNTLPQAARAARCVGQSMAAVLNDSVGKEE